METAQDLRGHNLPPTDIEILGERLKDAYGDLEKRVADLYEASCRVPDISDADTADKVTTLIKQIAVADKWANEARTTEKKPFLDSGRAVDAFFKPFSETLKNAKSAAGKKLTAYQVEQRRIAQEKAEAERKDKEEAARKEMESAKNEIDRQRAQEAMEQAEKVKAADTAVRSDYGNTSSLRTVTRITVEDVSKIPIDFFRRYVEVAAIEKAARAAIKNGVTDIPGIAITQEQQSIVR